MIAKKIVVRLQGRLGSRARHRTLRTGPPLVESLEPRCLLTAPPFAVGGDPIVNPADFQVTTFASGLNYPHGMQSLADGSLLVAVSNPVAGSSSFFDSTGELLRFTDSDGNGVADGPPQVLYNGLPGAISAVSQAGRYILATSTIVGQEQISVLLAGATPADPPTLVGSIDFTFPTGWEHTSYALATRPTPGQPGNYDVFFNIGSQFNGVEWDSQGNVILDSNGHAIPTPTTGTVAAGGLLVATLQGDSVYKVTLHDDSGVPQFSNLTQVAMGLRNAASLAIDPATGDLLLADNGIDGNNNGDEGWSADTLQRVPSGDMGVRIDNFGFPYHYTLLSQVAGEPGTRIDLTSSRRNHFSFGRFRAAGGSQPADHRLKEPRRFRIRACAARIPGRLERRGVHRLPRRF